MQRSIQEIEADFDRWLANVDEDLKKLGVMPDQSRGEARLREFARVGNLTFYHCGTSSTEPADRSSVRER